jgi:phosphoribosylaminoimidazole carboxylase PurE protein
MSSDVRVGVIMGSDSDWSVMSDAADALAEFDVAYEIGVYSAHRTPQRMLDYAQQADGRGIRVIIAGAGGAAHLPGMVASATPLPVIGVPVPLAKLDGLDSLLSIVQMPAPAMPACSRCASLRCRIPIYGKGSWHFSRSWPSRCWPRIRLSNSVKVKLPTSSTA